MNRLIPHTDGALDVAYDVTADVLYVKWPDVDLLSPEEGAIFYRKLLCSIKNYEVKRLLIKAQANAPASGKVSDFINQLNQKVEAHRLQKVACLEAEGLDGEAGPL